MSKGSINKVILIGNLGEDPQINPINNNGDLAANMSLATTESWKDSQSGQQQERTDWHRIVAYRGLASLAQQYLCKGSKIYIEGKLKTRKFKGQNDQDQYITEVVVEDMQMLGGPRKDQNSQGNSQGGGYQGQNNSQPQGNQGNYQHNQQGRQQQHNQR